ncbi:amino acid adenylation domain-containing protein [Streptomyces sp. NBC_00637]|uniref:amino acid adenylation domain-containing protein n=1 Tax=Streptomyces sp. NBC_00637 TaxID=2903667 RepID=UPI003249EF12
MGHGDSAEQSVHQLFAAHAAETPEAVAVVDGPTRLTYRELDERAEAVARLLTPARRTAPPSDSAGTVEVVIAVRLPRSAALVTALLATLKSGAAYLPLDPGLPAERTRRLLESAGARLLVTDSRLLPGPPLGDPESGAVPVLDLADARTARPADGARHASPTVSPHALAYLIHTSGSTGRPKPVAVEHHSLAHHALAARDRFGLTADDRVLQFTNPGFDVLAEEVFPTLAAGGSVVVLPDTSVSPLELEQFIRENGVTVANLPTPYWDQWGADLDLGPRDLPPTLRLLVVGSDTTHTRSLAAWRRHSRIPVINAYGLTETTITATTGRYPAEAGLPDTATLPIGTPLGGTEVRVLDAAMRPCPTGEAGELYVGGASPARGYHGLSGLTARRFVPDPFTDRPGARLYRTGDLVRQLDDGSLEFLGRGDQQVKIRGHRVEPAEVEAVLAELDGVRRCVVVPSGTGPETALIAYVVGDTDRAALRERAGRILPVYQVPADFVLLDALPVTAQGKVDRRALPAPDAGSREGSGPSEPPRGPIEERVAALWSEVLDGPAIGRNDDFRTLGGNSLDVVRILGRLRHTFGVPLTTREFLRAATVAGLAALLRDGGAEASVAPLPTVSTTPVAPGIVSTHEQRLWFLDQLHRGAGIAYNVPVALRLRGELDLSALRTAYQETVDRHPRLRTSFVSLDGRITAEASESAPADLPLVDLSHRPDAEAAALARAERLAGEHIDLGRGPLVRAELTRVAVDDHLLTVVFHHLVADGLSVDLFDRDLAAAYAARRTGADPRPPTGSLGYDHFARWQRDVADSPAADAALAYWRTGLSGAPFVLDLPTDHPRPAVMSYRGRRITRAAPTGLLHGVRTLARAEDTTPYCVVLTAVGAVLSEECGQPELLVASPTAGRPHPELDDVVGFFVNTVILRLRRTAGTTFRGWLGEVRETALDAFEHEYVAFDRLTAEFAPSRDLSRPPLVQCALAYQGERRPQARLAGLDATPVPLDNGTAKFDLTLEVEEVHGQLVLTAEYSSDLFEPATVERILDRVTACLTAAVAAPDAVLPALDAPAADRNTPHRTGVHGVLGGVVARCGGRVAVGDGVRELSYGELDRLSSVVAARLVAAGAGRGVLVALVGERDVDLVVGMVAVLKSGAGYVPLDPGFPVERLRETVVDAGCRVVLGKRAWAGVLDGEGVVGGVGGPVFVGLDDPVGAVEAEAGARWVGAPVVEGDTAYVIYTSGSTGRAKGVVVTHGNVLALFAACGEAFGGWGGDEVWSMFHSAAFDFSVWEVFGALLRGGRLRVVPYAVTRDPAAMWELVCREGVTVLSQTPTAFTQLVAAAAAQGFPATALRTVVFGGEALRPGSLKAWSAAYGWRGPRLVNMYGITETTVHVTYRPLTAADQDQAVSPIGTPLPGLTITLHPTTGTSGTTTDDGAGGGVEGAEMFVSGPQVAAGYLGRPALTAQRFLPDPDGPPGSRRYRTGDLAATSTTTHNTAHNTGSTGDNTTGGTSTVITAGHDTELHYLGRTDHQIKLRGFRIEPAEIERVLLTHPAVHAATVILNPHTPHHPQLAAYTVLTTPHHHTDTTLTDLRTHLTHHLPTHMIPTTLTPSPPSPPPPTANSTPPDSPHPPPQPNTPRTRATWRHWGTRRGSGRCGPCGPPCSVCRSTGSGRTTTTSLSAATPSPRCG